MLYLKLLVVKRFWERTEAKILEPMMLATRDVSGHHQLKTDHREVTVGLGSCRGTEKNMAPPWPGKPVMEGRVNGFMADLK